MKIIDIHTHIYPDEIAEKATRYGTYFGKDGGITVSGGEPLLQKDIAEFMRKVRDMGYSIKLDTNGCYPEKLKSIVNDGLVDYVAMDIKNCLSKYPVTVGIKNFDIAPIKESIEFLVNGNIDFEFRTTIAKELHTLEDIKALSEEIKGAKKYFLQNFVDSESVIKKGLHL